MHAYSRSRAETSLLVHELPLPLCFCRGSGGACPVLSETPFSEGRERAQPLLPLKIWFLMALWLQGLGCSPPVSSCPHTIEPQIFGFPEVPLFLQVLDNLPPALLCSGLLLLHPHPGCLAKRIGYCVLLPPAYRMMGRTRSLYNILFWTPTESKPPREGTDLGQAHTDRFPVVAPHLMTHSFMLSGAGITPSVLTPSGDLLSVGSTRG